MRRSSRLCRLTAGTTLAALLANSLPAGALAQQALPPLPQAPSAVPAQSQNDPPARVGRIARTTGNVSFRNEGDTQWSQARPNYPVVSGNSFWTEPAATTQLDISDSGIALAEQTELTVSRLDVTGLQAVAEQGETYYRLRDLAPNEGWTIVTPRGAVRLSGPGRYDIVVGTTEQPTLVTVLEGSAQIEAPSLALTVEAGQTATITGTDAFQGSIGPAIRSAFLASRLEAERPPPAVVPRQVLAMPGSEDLAYSGSWSDSPDYGQVWYPPVSAGWVPYREGHWAYVAPWGWTWVDDASWGFAPFHYGRWVELGGRWAWTPGTVAVAAPPVYAPALVSFIGIGAAVGAGLAVGAALAAGSIGWVPLAPHEPSHPWYHASPDYVRQVNVTHVSNVTTINNTTVNTTTINNFINRGAATSVPTAVMTQSRPIQPVAQAITPQQFAAVHPIMGQVPVRPAAMTAGVTPVVARQLNLGAAPIGHAAPGPAFRAEMNPGLAHPGVAFRPPLPGAGGSVPPAMPAGNAAAAPHPGQAAPGMQAVQPAAMPNLHGAVPQAGAGPGLRGATPATGAEAVHPPVPQAQAGRPAAPPEHGPYHPGVPAVQAGGTGPGVNHPNAAAGGMAPLAKPQDQAHVPAPAVAAAGAPPALHSPPPERPHVVPQPIVQPPHAAPEPRPQPHMAPAPQFASQPHPAPQPAPQPHPMPAAPPPHAAPPPGPAPHPAPVHAEGHEKRPGQS